MMIIFNYLLDHKSHGFNIFLLASIGTWLATLILLINIIILITKEKSNVYTKKQKSQTM